MSVDYKNLMNEAQGLSWWQRHKFMIMVVSAIVTAVFMVLVAMNLYNSSGTAQLDLSRPGYQSVRGQVERDAESTEFSSVGDINEKVLSEFRGLYKEKADQVIKADAFGPEAVSDGALGLPAITDK